MATAADQMRKAKALIQQKRYDDAKALLVTVDHPKADVWLERLNQMTKTKTQSQQKFPLVKVGVLAGVVGALIIIVGVVVNSYVMVQYERIAVENATQTVATQQAQYEADWLAVATGYCQRNFETQPQQDRCVEYITTAERGNMAVEELCDAALNYWAEADYFHECGVLNDECQTDEHESFSDLRSDYMNCYHNIETTIE